MRLGGPRLEEPAGGDGGGRDRDGGGDEDGDGDLGGVLHGGNVGAPGFSRMTAAGPTRVGDLRRCPGNVVVTVGDAPETARTSPRDTGLLRSGAVLTAAPGIQGRRVRPSDLSTREVVPHGH
ncbi:hypothetical protein JCM11754A_16220 [Isoptericola variabilis]